MTQIRQPRPGSGLLFQVKADLKRVHTASKRRGNDIKGFTDSCMKDKAIIWP